MRKMCYWIEMIKMYFIGSKHIHGENQKEKWKEIFTRNLLTANQAQKLSVPWQLCYAVTQTPVQMKCVSRVCFFLLFQIKLNQITNWHLENEHQSIRHASYINSHLLPPFSVYELAVAAFVMAAIVCDWKRPCSK